MTSMQLPPELSRRFEGTMPMRLDSPTAGGRTEFLLNAEVIDGDAKSFFGRGYCHWLAGAIHCMTGWDLLTYEKQQPDGSWLPAHTAVVTPHGRVLDIFGEHDSAAVARAYATSSDGSQYTVRTRRVRNEDMCGEVIRGADHLQGDPLWWSRGPYRGDMTTVFVHFARLLVTKHNYREHLLENRPNRPASTAIPAARPTPETHTTPSSGGTSMGIDEIRQTVVIANEKALYACGALREARNQFDEIVSQLTAIGLSTSSQDGPKQAMATYSQLRDQLDAFQDQISTALTSLEQYAHQV
ncbi:hypothetical protein ABT324_08820 [Saccharopolyspora sp. NPDC000359]|uniref:hypothetical protein n=1 Tax=Saccharopolyspora sp. NPDC000359 TaxID=3154251 RepID=UPI00331FAC6C